MPDKVCSSILRTTLEELAGRWHVGEWSHCRFGVCENDWGSEKPVEVAREIAMGSRSAPPKWHDFLR